MRLDVKEAIENRRAYRSIEKVEINDELIKDLAGSARLAASCFNYQPWQYVFVHDKEILTKMHGALSQGNEWAQQASMIIAVFSNREDDCVIKEREYYLFDTGMATAQLILRATELGLVAHPIAGFSPNKTREILGIPEKMNIITLVIVGKKSDKINPVLVEHQVEAENERPERKALEDFVHINRYKE
jgi:nitroreductase